ncbi:NfeD family protein [Psychrilyobacter atlanticus]|uniref:NfeD family protein n=1 Tax=Psychrilyobacter atlanticus TaxID=271091 RepID=UPI000405CE7F|nr:NfeD family protein [Psychrilyobacter atlanticus]
MIWDSGMIWWFLLTIVFIGVELAAPALVSIWFAFAAIILTLISGMVKNPINEFYIFVGLSGFFLILTRPIAKKLLEKRKPIESRIFGQDVEISKKIEADLYEVKLDGKYWRATCDEKLEVGDAGVVERVEGNKLILKKKI